MARKPRSKKAPHPVTVYARSVVNGKTPAGRLVKLACKRHLSDLRFGKKRGLYFDEVAANHALGFFRFCRHSKGEWAGRAIRLDLWQQFIIGSLFGWKRSDGTRRFRNAYVEVPRKNGKTTIAGGIGLYLLIADGEPGAEVYSAATKRDQAKLVFNAARHMVLGSPPLFKRITVLNNNLNIPSTAAKFEPLSSEAKSLDGLNVHGAILDEVHAHPTRELYDVIDTATGSRRQSLLFEITTAGFDRLSICWEHHEYSVNVLEGTFTGSGADSWFAYIATIDKGDRWDDPKSWIKANPGYGVSVKPEDLERKCDKAKDSPAAQYSFRQKHLDEWTEQADRWLDIDVWNRGSRPVVVDELIGRECYAGLDLARVNDLSALALLFPPLTARERWKVLMRFWCPNEDIKTRDEQHRAPYRLWRDQGHLVATDGNTTDFDFIEAAILEDVERFQVLECGYDRYFAGALVNNMTEAGVEMVPVGQGYVSLAAPTAELERLVKAGELAHGGHPILKWNAGNVIVTRDPAGNMKPDKAKSREKIDGISALINALNRALRNEAEEGSDFSDDYAEQVA